MSRSKCYHPFCPCSLFLQPVISLDGRISYTFTSEGMNTVTAQVSSANAIPQDTKTIAVQEFFKSLLLSFSPNLDEYKPDIPEWRQDVGRVIKKALLQYPWWIPSRDTAVQQC
ncbi:VPS10 domain-containing receptor SorCS1-like [Oncorhynchus mykiss]|uniref:VPS10 domain-containing receptor SorCS1-like n=1 Tax=Oncorhynchus mykiss TaxID=8022 RepID=UPI0018775CAD|nr:VPS10 domain-containing receptor SorCS1-like [Oncorhynchus mykiss]